MKLAIVTAAATAALLVLPGPFSSTADAHGWKKRHYHSGGRVIRYRGHHRRYYSQREIDRLPIRITRPPNASHYIYDDYPLWAARAFERPRDR